MYIENIWQKHTLLEQEFSKQLSTELSKFDPYFLSLAYTSLDKILKGNFLFSKKVVLCYSFVIQFF